MCVVRDYEKDDYCCLSAFNKGRLFGILLGGFLLIHIRTSYNKRKHSGQGWNGAHTCHIQCNILYLTLGKNCKNITVNVNMCFVPKCVRKLLSRRSTSGKQIMLNASYTAFNVDRVSNTY